MDGQRLKQNMESEMECAQVKRLIGQLHLPTNRSVAVTTSKEQVFGLWSRRYGGGRVGSLTLRRLE